MTGLFRASKGTPHSHVGPPGPFSTPQGPFVSPHGLNKTHQWLPAAPRVQAGPCGPPWAPPGPSSAQPLAPPGPMPSLWFRRLAASLRFQCRPLPLPLLPSCPGLWGSPTGPSTFGSHGMTERDPPRARAGSRCTHSLLHSPYRSVGPAVISAQLRRPPLR